VTGRSFAFRREAGAMKATLLNVLQPVPRRRSRLSFTRRRRSTMIDLRAWPPVRRRRRRLSFV
jgi:hypothetical protein